MRRILIILSIWAATGLVWIDPPQLSAQQAGKPQPRNQRTNAAANGPGWQSQYPLSAQTTGRPSFSSTFPFGINKTSGLTSNGENLLVAEGELFKVDSKGQRLWVRTSEEREFVFYYTDATEILAGAAGVEGLVPTNRHFLRVLYTQEGGRVNAMHIELLPRVIQSPELIRARPVK